MRTQLLPRLVLAASMLSLSACASSDASDAGRCDAPTEQAAFAQGEQWSQSDACEGDLCSTPLPTDHQNVAEEAPCALAGLKAGLHRRRGHDKHDGHGKHDRGHHDHGRCETKQCKQDGHLVGDTAAALYCDLSLALGGIGEDELLPSGPESACSRAFEKECHRAFDRTVADYAKLSGDPAADCVPFTKTEFRRAYEIARRNQCLFSVGTPPTDPCADGACECRDQKTCELSCEGPGCDLLCEHASRCDIECLGPDCDVQCRDVKDCRVRIDEGTVRCDHVGKCRVECVKGKRAKRNRDGSIVCEPKRHR